MRKIHLKDYFQLGIKDNEDELFALFEALINRVNEHRSRDDQILILDEEKGKAIKDFIATAIKED
jgi:hypothetical protein